MNEKIYTSMLFKGMTPEETDRILEGLGAVEKHYDRFGTVMHPSKDTDEIGIASKGVLQIIKEDYWGNRAIISNIHEGEIFGEAYCVKEHACIPFSVIAITEASAVFISYSKLFCGGLLPCASHNRLLYNLTRSLTDKNLALSSKISHITERSTRDKLMSYLSEQAHMAGKPDFTIPFNRQELADYLSVDRSAMSLELSKLRREGLIEYKKNSFHFI